MIRSYRDRDTEHLAARQRVRKWSPERSRTGQGQHSIRINDQWRICFRWEAGNAHDVGKRSVTADTALRLARYFGTTPRFWLNLQTQYDLDIEVDRLGNRLDHEVAAHAG